MADSKRAHEMIDVGGQEIRVSNPARLYFPAPGRLQTATVAFPPAAKGGKQ